MSGQALKTSTFLFSLSKSATEKFNHVMQLGRVRLKQYNAFRLLDIRIDNRSPVFSNIVDPDTGVRMVDWLWINIYAGCLVYIHTGLGAVFDLTWFKEREWKT